MLLSLHVHCFLKGRMQREFLGTPGGHVTLERFALFRECKSLWADCFHKAVV